MSASDSISASASLPPPTDTTTRAANANAVTEDEAALYDRQIRLWGLEAQTRMRTSHVLVWGFTGVATEVIKNTVLSGVGTLSILDGATVSDEDLGAGFFWRVEDVGSSRVAEVPISRVQALNSLVKVRGVTDESIFQGTEAEVSQKIKQMSVDVVVACKGGKAELISLNNAARLVSTKFYASASFGFGGFIFSDLGASHDFITERVLPASSSSSQPEKKKIKNRTTFVTLRESLEVSWKGMDAKKLRRVKLTPGLFSVWAKWDVAKGDEVDEIVKRLLNDKGVQEELVFEKMGVDRKAWFETLKTSWSIPGEFAPTCAILGGLLSQDILNALGGREEPIVNWLILDAMGSGNATLHAVGQGLQSETGVGA